MPNEKINSSHFSQRFIIALMAVVIVLMFAVSASATYLILSSAPAQKTTTQPPVVVSNDDMSDWQTYTDPECHFSVQYPADWVAGDPDSNTGCIQIYPPDAFNPQRETVVPSLHFKAATASDIFEGSLVNVRYFTTKSGGEAVQETKEGIPHLQVTGFKSFNGSYIGATRPLSVEHKDIFDQILSTFRFTEDMSDWQTYTNSKLGISFQYPTDWDEKKDSLPDSINKDRSSLPNQNLMLPSPNGDTNFFLLINPDGFGPFFPDMLFHVINRDNGLEITERQVQEPSENNNPDGYNLIISSVDSDWPRFWMQASSPISEKDKLIAQLEHLITSFRFTE